MPTASGAVSGETVGVAWRDISPLGLASFRVVGVGELPGAQAAALNGASSNPATEARRTNANNTEQDANVERR